MVFDLRQVQNHGYWPNMQKKTIHSREGVNETQRSRMNTDIENFKTGNQCGVDELTRQDIAKLLGVTPQRVFQYKFLPKPIRQITRSRARTVFYSKNAVMEAIHKQYPNFGKPKSTTIVLCKKNATKSIMLRFLTGQFDNEERRRGYDELKFKARTHPVKTKQVRVKGEFSMKGKG